MKAKLIVLLSVFFALSFPAVSMAENEYKYEESFNDYQSDTALPEDVFHTGGTGTVLIKEIGDDNKALSFEMAPKNQYRINNIIPVNVLGADRFVFEEKIKVGSSANIYAQLYTGMAAGDPYKTGKNRIIFNAISGNIQNHDGNVIIEDAYTPDTWFYVRTVFYQYEDEIRYDIHIFDENGVLVKSAYEQTTSADFGATLIKSGTIRIRNFAFGDTKTGLTDTVWVDDIHIYEVSEPQVSNISVDGALKVGVELTVKYDYVESYGNQDDSTYEWYRNGEIIDGATSSGYVLTDDDYQKEISVKITPKSIVSTGAETVEYIIGTVEKLQNKIPEASELEISGTPETDSTITAKYIYTGEDSVLEGESLVTWYRRAKDSQDGEKIGNGSTYTVKTQDEGSYIYFTVVPKDAEGTMGNEYKSDEVYITQRPYISFDSYSFYSGFGNIKSEITELKKGTSSFEVTASSVSKDKKEATVVAMLMYGDELESMIVFPATEWEYGQEKTYAGSFKVQTAKNREIRIVALNSIDEMNIVSSSTLKLSAK